MLHHVGDENKFNSLKPYSISRKTFVSLLSFIEQNDFITANVQDLSKKKISGKKRIFLTFDDCGKHLFDFAIPELLRRNMTASFFIPTANIGKHNDWESENCTRLELMNKSDLIQLSSLGMEVGSHSHNHIRLADAGFQNASEQLRISKSRLENIISAEVLSIAYPYGSIPAKYLKLVKDAGYKYALGIYCPHESNLTLRRFIYHDGDNERTLSRKLSGLYKLYRVITDPMKSSK